jgi:hypothetical protein
MKTNMKKIQPDEFILSVLKPNERLKAALKISAEAFKNKTLTEEDIVEAVRYVRKKNLAKKK